MFFNKNQSIYLKIYFSIFAEVASTPTEAPTPDFSRVVSRLYNSRTLRAAPQVHREDFISEEKHKLLSPAAHDTAEHSRG